LARNRRKITNAIEAGKIGNRPVEYFAVDQIANLFGWSDFELDAGSAGFIGHTPHSYGDHALGCVACMHKNTHIGQEQSVLACTAIQLQNAVTRTKGLFQCLPNHITLRPPDQRVRENIVILIGNAVEGDSGAMRRGSGTRIHASTSA
jgi:hypothetical protein